MKAKRLPQNIARRTAAGAAWLIGARLGAKLIDLVTLLILARLLQPTEFGLVAVAMTLILIIEAVFELPVNQVLVRLPDPSSSMFDTAFTLGALRGLVLALLLSAIAVPFSVFYHNPDFVMLLGFLGVAPIARGLLSPHLATYARNFDFRRDFIIELSGKVLAFVSSVAVAYHLHNHWALVVGIVASPVGMLVASYIAAPYRPRLSFQGWRVFAGFLGWTTASQLVSAINWQCDRLLLGRFVSLHRLGQFSLANDLAYLPEQALIKPIMRPLMVAFSHVRDDPARLAEAYTKAVTAVFALGLPIMTGLSLLADPAVRLMLGGKWLEAVPILQWLALSLIPALFVSPLIPLTMALNRTDVFLRFSTWELVVRLPVMVLGVSLLGVQGVIGARMATALVTALVGMLYVQRLIGIPLIRQLASSWRVVVSGLVMGAVVVPLRIWLVDADGLILILKLGTVAAAGFSGYVAAMVGLCTLGGGEFEAGLVAQARARLQRPGPPRKNLVYLILGTPQWTQWQADGDFVVRPYTHMLAAADQISAVARQHFVGERNLMLIEIDLRVLGNSAAWEHESHCYRSPDSNSSIPLAAVTQARSIDDFKSEGTG
ncbi:MAG: putative rane protein of unknown function with polysaccharide biosynthesis protein domain [Sphingomonadales bacterium]|nr:putative rane protein of unknown function with polysaccharide biosynthesis protein domain [Sphingomonadales bacterium]